MVFSKRDLGPGGDLRVEKKLQLLPLTDKQIRLYVKRHVNMIAGKTSKATHGSDS